MYNLCTSFTEWPTHYIYVYIIYVCNILYKIYIYNNIKMINSLYFLT